MRRILITLVLVALIGSAVYASDETLGVAVKLPWAGTMQLALPMSFALEAGISSSGPGIAAVKLYFDRFGLDTLSLVPYLGAASRFAFLYPVTVVHWSIVGGLEVLFPEQPLTFTGAIVVPLADPIGGIWVEAGVRLGIW